MTYIDTLAHVKAEALIEAKRLGVKVAFSRKLEWAAIEDKLVLITARRSRRDHILTLYVDALLTADNPKHLLKQALLNRDVDYIQDPETGRFEGSRPQGGGDDDSGGGERASAAAIEHYAKTTQSQHAGLSSDFDLRPHQPMPSQSIVATVPTLVAGRPVVNNVEVLINPSTRSVRSMISEGGIAPGSEDFGVRVMQDRVGNLFVWPAYDAIHADMMDVLEPVERAWDADLFELREGKLVSQTVPGISERPHEWIERGRENAKQADTASVGFVSPNVRTDLDFAGAVEALKSPQQGSLLAASTEIDRAVGIKAKEANIIGAWADGAENSIMMTSGADWDHTVLATVMKGHLADQKSVLVFQQTHGGDAVLASFHAKGKLEDIHRNLLEDGLAFHTLVPSKGGATVYVCDLDGSAADAVEKASERYDAKVTTQHGKAEFFGDSSGEGSDREQRDRARSIYEKIIRESPVSGSAKIWTDIRDRWGKTAVSKNLTQHAGDTPEEAQKFQTEKLIKDGPSEGTSRVRVVRDRTIGLWGGSHSGSKTITGHSAKVMGIDGYHDSGATEEAENLGNKFLDVIAEGHGAGERLYHGFKNSEDIKWKIGDTLRLPLMAASGDLEDAAGYGVNYVEGVDNSDATVFEFPESVPMAGYSRWDRENTKEFGHTWAEAIVAGEFKVSGIRTEHEPGWRNLPVTVVSLEPIGVFDRTTGKWRKL